MKLLRLSRSLCLVILIGRKLVDGYQLMMAFKLSSRIDSCWQSAFGSLNMGGVCVCSASLLGFVFVCEDDILDERFCFFFLK